MHRLPIYALGFLALLFADPILAQDAPTGGRSLSSPQEQQQADDAMNTEAGRAGTDQPGAHVPTTNYPVFKGGKFDVPGAPTQSQTTPGAPDHTVGKGR